MNPDLSLEEATGLSVGAGASPSGARVAEFDDINSARADEYALIASLLLRAPDAGFLARLGGLQGAATPLGLAHDALGQAARSAEAVDREYFELFIGIGRGELIPYASYYLTGFLNERPLARLRGDMRRLGLERAEAHTDPEDHLGSLCEIMSGFAGNRFEIAADDEYDFFTRHIASWAGRFFADLEKAQSARFYRAVGAVGRIFIDIEAEGFAMEARPSG
ncbi:molecular chaperone TorD [Pseudaminobacter arsenicus]|uniref:Molecular chaperone TorD n=1 Tax=Borborobacter arsenicus TaxID=1851146 RepID=A0A432V171_9HYPH|nr:molecular chaperone TorD family protein [Pseudaminobacter arsenicus]RUM95838.1 molecular chaperone TorD [Pseudaminobacter arsenicus]